MWKKVAAALFAVASIAQPQLHAQSPEVQELAKKARTVLANACHRCHGNNGSVEGGFSFVLDRQQLVARNMIVPGNSAKSKVLRKIEQGEMPPEGENPRPSKEDVAVIKRWIEAGAPDFNPAAPARKYIYRDRMIQSMHDDIQKLPEVNRKFIRYFTLTHLYDAGRSEDELQSFRFGISKLVNSLSWGRRIVAPLTIDPEQTILRIDTRDYKWTTAVWDLIAGTDPYAVIYPSQAARELYKDAGCGMPYVRGDWFVSAAARPPLYHEILQLPATEKELEALVHVDVDNDIRTLQTARAGFNGSSVSRNNRVIERHESSYGYYWKSYDFASNVNRQNIFAFPLGPGGNAKTFEHSAGEIIFSLANGLQGYMLVDGNGQRINKGATEIVSDVKRPDRAVENGLSCMSCHVRGLIPKEDQVRDHVEKNSGAFRKSELEAIRALYIPKEKFQGLVRADADKYREAVERTGSRIGITEPVAALTTLFESVLDMALASAELGMKPEDLEPKLRQSAQLSRVLGALLTSGGTAQRDAFAGIFPEAIRILQLGTTPIRTNVPREALVGGSFTALGGKNPFPRIFVPNRQVSNEMLGLQMGTGVYVRTRKSDFLTKDFKFELVLTIKEADKITFVGIGEADANNSHKEPGNSVCLRIHPPSLGGGEVDLSNAPAKNLEKIGHIPKLGTHRVIIEKKGDSVHFAIDVNNDGPSSDDIEKTVPDIKTIGPFLNTKNTAIFFGGGGTTFKQFRLVE